MAALALLLGATDALHLDAAPRRRTALVSALAAVTTLRPGVTIADGTDLGNSALGATCLGFGCNSYGRPDFNGLEKAAAPPGSLPYSDFLELVKQKKVEGVVFMPPSGDVAYALIDGKKVRIGEGWPIETGNSWSSPSWVVRILQNQDVPYAFDYDLLPAKKKTYPKPGEKKGYSPYVPAQRVAVRPEDGLQPKMYGTGETEENQLAKSLGL